MTEEKMPALPEPDGFMDQSLGGFLAYSADAMLAFRAEGEATLRARLAVSEALVHDLAKDLERLRAQRDEAVAALGGCARAYVNLMEASRDRLVDLGGNCDPVDVMERNDPHLRELRATLASLKEQAA